MGENPGRQIDCSKKGLKMPRRQVDDEASGFVFGDLVELKTEIVSILWLSVTLHMRKGQRAVRML